MKPKNVLKRKIFLALSSLCLALPANMIVSPPAKALKPYEQDMINIYKKLAPSIVSVRTVTYQENFFMEMIPTPGAGSGFVIDKEGHIVTNYHVIDGANQINVFFGEKSYPAKLIGGTANNDLAIIQVQAPANILVPAKLGNSSKLQVGQTVAALGNPFGILGRTMTAGIISAVDRDVKIENTIYRGMIQTDAAINSGNSGGPLVNSDGEVIGINTLIFSRSGGSVGIGFAIPIDIAKKFIPSLITRGEVVYPWLGVSVLPLTEEIARYLKIPVKSGLLVLNTVKGSSAANAGLKGGSRYIIAGNNRIPVGGDVIVGLDNEKISTLAELSSYLDTNKSVGDTVTVRVLRNNKVYSVPVKLQARPTNR